MLAAELALVTNLKDLGEPDIFAHVAIAAANGVMEEKQRQPILLAKAGDSQSSRIAVQTFHLQSGSEQRNECRFRAREICLPLL